MTNSTLSAQSIQPAKPGRVTIKAMPAKIQVGAKDCVRILVTVDDALGNPLDGAEVTVEVDQGDLSPLSGTTANGLFEAFLIPDAKARHVKVSATSNGMSDSLHVRLFPGPPHQIDIEPENAELCVGGNPLTITARVFDEYRNLVADGAPITFATDLGNLTSTTAYTRRGLAKVDLLPGTRAGKATASATCGTCSTSFTVKIAPRPARKLLISAVPPDTTVNGPEANLTVLLVDEYDNPVADGTYVVLSTSLGALTVGEDWTSNGELLACLKPGTKAGEAMLSTALDGVEPAFALKIQPGPPQEVRVSADRTCIRTGGEKILVRAQVTDQYGNPVADTTPTSFRATEGDLSQPTEMQHGEVSATLTSRKKPGVVVVSVQSAGVCGVLPVYFMPLFYRLDTIRKLLTEAFSAKELYHFCFDHFHDVCESFPSDPPLDLLVQRLLEYCHRKERITELLDLVEKRNPRQFFKHQELLLQEKEPERPKPKRSGKKRKLQIRLAMNLEGCSDEVRENASVAAREALAARLAIDPESIPVEHVQADGLTLRVSMPARAARELQRQHERSDPNIQHMGIEEVASVPFTEATEKRCGVCERLIPTTAASKCPVCGSRNQEWWRITPWKWFPAWFWAVLAGVVLLEMALVWVAARNLPQTSVRALWIAGIGAIISIILLVAVFSLRNSLRKYEFLRMVKTKMRGPSLLSLAALATGVALLCALGMAFLLWSILVYSARADSEMRIREMATGAVYVRYKTGARIASPSWSPNGQSIIFASDSDGDWDIYSLSGQSARAVLLTNNTTADQWPVWSPNGTQIYYASNQNGTWQIFVMEADGRDPKQITAEQRRATDPAISADGRWLAYLLTTPAFSVLLGDTIDLAERGTLLVAVLYAVLVPCLNLALMLVGVRSYIGSVDQEFSRPVFLDTNHLAEVALQYVRKRLQIQDEDSAKPPVSPIGLTTTELAEKTHDTVVEVGKILNIPPDSSGTGLVLVSVGGMEHGGLGFVFEHPQEHRRYQVESGFDGKIAVQICPPTVRLRVISVSRTETGGLKIVVGKTVETEKKEAGKPEIVHVTQEERYEAETNEWGDVRSLKELESKEAKGLWAN